ncbi:ImmA/IrrE family metallo-endopeptidase [Ideonella sp.]|uniref:ImmA/IrrE family metallo-endopeptidase n=1 Tax=Ideonella sp. TaxID=1929293 RepID=UPI0035B489B8
MLERYADVVDAGIPIAGVDGVCLNLKVPGKRPRVVINSANPPLRRRFTEAHELGHIVIPWHRGTIVDHLDPEHVEAKDDYWLFEEEANQFAAELLMPSDWLEGLLESTPDLSQCHKCLSEECEVSALAAARRLSSVLPPNIVFIAEKNGEVEFSGRTPGTLAKVPAWQSMFDPGVFRYATGHHTSVTGTRRLHWWTLPDKVAGVTTDPRPWREILDEMVTDIGVPPDDQKRFKMSVNGVVAAANSAMKQRGTHTAPAVIAACLQRFHDRNDLTGIAAHPSFMDFVSKRASELTQ